MASEAVTEALANLRQAMLDDDMDEATVDAILHAAQPNETNLVGNFADLQRVGAREVGTDEAYVMPATQEPGAAGGTAATAEEATASVGSSSATALEDMTKAELQAEADRRGIDVNASMTKAEIVAALEEG